MADAATAVRKLQSGQPLTDDERKLLGMSNNAQTQDVSTTLAPVVSTTLAPVVAKVVSTYTDPETGDIIDVYDDATEKVRKKGTKALDAAAEAKAIAAGRIEDQQSAYDILDAELTPLGLGGLLTDIKKLIGSNIPASQFSLELRKTDAYQARFAANDARIKAGLRALSPAEYIGLEDEYQNIMRNYGLPASYYTKDATGKQVGFEKFLAGDVSATELEDRIVTAQKRVINANPEVAAALKEFYPDITNGDILAYTLDPTQGLEAIKRKVTAAEIGGAAMAQKLGTSVSRAEELARYGVTKDQAQKGFETVAGVAPRGGQLAAIYGEDPYTQATAETEVFGLGGSAEAKRKREKLSALETSAFSGQSGMTQGALSRDRAGAF